LFDASLVQEDETDWASLNDPIPGREMYEENFL